MMYDDPNIGGIAFTNDNSVQMHISNIVQCDLNNREDYVFRLNKE